MRAFAAFVRLSRPLFLYGGFAGVALGAAVAAWSGRRLDPSSYLWAQGLVTSFQLMVHYANDYFDRECDAGARRTAWSGGSGVLTDGSFSPRIALFAALACAACGLAATARFALAGNATAGWLGLAIAVCAWCYSAPPLRLTARGWGELDTILIVAVLVPCAGYAAFTGSLDGAIFTAAGPPAVAMLVMMLCVELPDAASDFIGGKHNLVVRWGPARTWQIISVAAGIAPAMALGVALQARGPVAVPLMAPAAVCAAALVLRAWRDPRPATMAFWGVALYATLVSGLAAAYALAAPR